jgi:hypothetical protein
MTRHIICKIYHPILASKRGLILLRERSAPYIAGIVEQVLSPSPWHFVRFCLSPDAAGPCNGQPSRECRMAQLEYSPDGSRTLPSPHPNVNGNATMPNYSVCHTWGWQQIGFRQCLVPLKFQKIYKILTSNLWTHALSIKYR